MLYGQIKIAVETYEASPLWKRPVSGIVGRAFSPLYALMMANEDFLKPGPEKTDLDAVKGYYNRDQQDKKKDIELAMYANEAHPIENLKRIWNRKGLSVPGKVIGSVMSPIADGITALTRADHYNPYAHSITSYTNSPGIKFHEMGHAEDFSKMPLKVPYALARGLPFLSIPATLYQEGKASQLAGKPLNEYIKTLPQQDQQFERIKANATLNGGYGSYVGGMIGGAIGEPLGGLISAPIALSSRLLGATNWTGK